MLLSNNVGAGAPNASQDVKIVQLLLNMNRSRVDGAGALTVDGAYGNATLRAIQDFQTQVVGMKPATGVVSNESTTLAALQQGLPAGLTAEKFNLILLAAKAAQLGSFYQPVVDRMNAAGLNTPLRQAHFLAQIGHESGDLRYTEELASGEAYEGRKDLGNTQPGDGVRFKGRGLIQLTGRANYVAYGATIGMDLTVDNNWTKLATDPTLAVDVACWFWNKHGLSAFADKDDITTITKRINGGLNGLADRQTHLDRAKFVLVAV